MGILFVVSAVTLFSAGWFGWLRHTSGLWHWADPIYYPLVTAGVVLLFLSNENDRRMIELVQSQQDLRTILGAPIVASPELERFATTPVLTKGLQTILAVAEFGSACPQRGDEGQDCLVSAKLAPQLRRFVSQDASSDQTAVIPVRLAIVCQGARPFLLSVVEWQAMSPFVGAELIRYYDELQLKRFDYYEYPFVERYLQAFPNLIYRRIEDARTSIVSSIAISQYTTEARIAVTLLRGLSMCLVGSEELLAIASLVERKQSAQSRIPSVEAEINALKEGNASSWRWRLFYLELWPYVLVLALSFKFAKAMAQLRLARAK